MLSCKSDHVTDYEGIDAMADEVNTVIAGYGFRISTYSPWGRFMNMAADMKEFMDERGIKTDTTEPRPKEPPMIYLYQVKVTYPLPDPLNSSYHFCEECELLVNGGHMKDPGACSISQFAFSHSVEKELQEPGCAGQGRKHGIFCNRRFAVDKITIGLILDA